MSGCRKCDAPIAAGSYGDLCRSCFSNNEMTISLPTLHGDAVATKPRFVDEPWEIGFPWGDHRMYGSRAEVESEMKKRIKANTISDSPGQGEKGVR